MKLIGRERVDGTTVTIGRRQYYRDKKQITSRYYAAEYRDDAGKQTCENLGTTNLREARRKAIEIAQRLEQGKPKVLDTKLTVDEVVDGYFDMVKARGLAKKTEAKYRTDLDKLQVFCRDKKVGLAHRFNRELFFQYRSSLAEKKYADKTIYGALTLTKQVFKWRIRKASCVNTNSSTPRLKKLTQNPSHVSPVTRSNLFSQTASIRSV